MSKNKGKRKAKAKKLKLQKLANEQKALKARRTMGIVSVREKREEEKETTTDFMSKIGLMGTGGPKYGGTKATSMFNKSINQPKEERTGPRNRGQ